MKHSAKLAILTGSILLGACSTLPLAQPTASAKPKPKPRPVASMPQLPALPQVAPAQPLSPVSAPASPAASSEAAATSVAPPVPSSTASPAVVTTAVAGDADTRFKAALDLLKQNQPQEAEVALNALSKDFPQFSGPLTDLGILYARSKRIQPAVAALTQATAVNPQNAMAFNWLGIVLRESREYVRAEQAYKQALILNPNHAAANLNLGILYDAYLGRPREALPYYRNYQRLGGQDDLRVRVWIAQIEKLPPAAAPVTVPAPQPLSPTSKPKPRPALPGIQAPQESHS